MQAFFPNFSFFIQKIENTAPVPRLTGAAAGAGFPGRAAAALFLREREPRPFPVLPAAKEEIRPQRILCRPAGICTEPFPLRAENMRRAACSGGPAQKEEKCVNEKMYLNSPESGNLQFACRSVVRYSVHAADRNSN